jgi:hypothetical protein
MLNLAGHTIVGVGYDDSSNTVYIHDTWDNNDHTMTWGSSYSGMLLQSVSIVNLQESARQGTLGTEITITGSGFGDKKGKVLVGGLAQKVESWSNTSISVAVTKPPLPVEQVYDLSIQPKEPKGTPPINLLGGFIMKNPTTLNPLLVSNGSPGTEITITGKFFSTKKGKVYLEDPSTGKKKNCKVTAWYMEPTNGESSLTFVVPKLPKGLLPGPYPLKIANKIGTAEATFTVEP